MKTITYEFMNNALYTGTFLISSQGYELVKDKLDKYIWKRDSFNNYNTEDTKYYIKRPYDYDKSLSSVIFEEISLLIQEGFDLSPKAQEQFNYWSERHKETEKRLQEEREKQLAREREKQLAREREKQEQAKYDYILWCDKYACRTTRTSCNNCERGWRMGCRPALMKVKTI